MDEFAKKRKDRKGRKHAPANVTGHSRLDDDPATNGEPQLGPTRTLQFKLTLALLLAALVPVTVGMLYAFSTTRTALKANTLNTLDMNSSAVSDHVHHIFEKARLSVISVVENVNFRRILLAPSEREEHIGTVQQNLERMSRRFPNVKTEVYLIDNRGVEIAKAVNGEAAPESDLDTHEQESEFFAPTAALEAGETHVAGPYKSHDTELLVMGISAPIFSGKGVRLGMVHVEIPMEGLFAGLDEHKRAKKEFTLAVDQEGRLLYHSSLGFDDEKILAPASDGATASKKAMFKEMAEGESGMKTYTSSGHLHHVAVSPLGWEHEDGVKWSIATGVPIESIYGQSTSLTIIYIVAGLAVILGFLLSLLLGKGIARPIKDAIKITARVAQGNLTGVSRGRGRDETGLLRNSINQMIQGLRNLISKVKEASNHVTSTASEILASSEEQASTSRKQLEAVSETTATVEQLAATAKQIAERAEVVAQAASETHKNAESGHQAFLTTTEGMARVKEKVENIASTTLTLGEISQQIGNILTIINEIADQTNLLSLNAAIEAARAGEHGRGFAVVASEVRKLAERSVDATNNIRDLISEIQSQTNETIMATEEGLNEVKQGTELAQEAAGALNDILEKVGETTKAAQEISMATGQQQSASEQVVMAMANIVTASKEAATGSQQAATAAREMMQLASEFKDSIRRFQVEKNADEVAEPEEDDDLDAFSSDDEDLEFISDMAS